MPISIDRSGLRIRFTMTGRYAFEDVLEGVSVAANRGGSTRSNLGLLDVRLSEEVRSSSELRLLARLFAETQTFSKIAVVASKTVHYGLARMLSVYAESEGLEISAFRSEEAALEWLAAS